MIFIFMIKTLLKISKQNYSTEKSCTVLLPAAFWYDLIHLCLCGILAAMHGFPQLCEVGTFSCGARASRCSGFSRCGARALGHAGFGRCGTQGQQVHSQALEHKLNSCGTWAELLHDMWNLPGPGIEPVTHASCISR